MHAPEEAAAWRLVGPNTDSLLLAVGLTFALHSQNNLEVVGFTGSVNCQGFTSFQVGPSRCPSAVHAHSAQTPAWPFCADCQPVPVSRWTCYHPKALPPCWCLTPGCAQMKCGDCSALYGNANTGTVNVTDPQANPSKPQPTLACHTSSTVTVDAASNTMSNVTLANYTTGLMAVAAYKTSMMTSPPPPSKGCKLRCLPELPFPCSEQHN